MRTSLLVVLLAVASRASAQTVLMPVLQGDPIAGSAGPIVGPTIYGPTLNSSCNIAFNGMFNGLRYIASDVGGLHTIALENAQPPGLPSGNRFFYISDWQHVLDDLGRTHFSPRVAGPQAVSGGVWSETSPGVVQLQAASFIASPTTPQGYYFMVPGGSQLSVSRSGRLAFSARFNSTEGSHTTYNAVFSGTPGNIVMHARTEAPAGPGGILQLESPTGVNEGGVYLGLLLSPSSDGGAAHGAIFTGPPSPPPGTGVLTPVFDCNEPVRDYTGGNSMSDVRFQSVTADVNEAGSLSCLATFNRRGSQVSGIYVVDGARPRMVALANDQVPGLPPGVRWHEFDKPIICDAGDTFFVAHIYGGGTLPDNRTVICRYRGQTLSIVARGGMQAPGRPAGTLLNLPSTFDPKIGCNAFGQLAFIGTIFGRNTLLATDRTGNLSIVYASGDTATIADRGGAGGFARNLAITSGILPSGGSDGRPSSINHRGQIALVATSTIPPGQPAGPSGTSIVVFQAPTGGCGGADIGRAGGGFGADGQLDNNDFMVYIDRFFASDPIADVGVAGGLPGFDGAFDNNDFIAFIATFFSGC